MNMRSTWLIIALLSFVALPCHADEPPADEQMDDIALLIARGQFWAKAEVRYQQDMMDRYALQSASWSWWSVGFSAASVLAAVVIGNIEAKKVTKATIESAARPERFLIAIWSPAFKRSVSAILVVVGFAGFYASMRSADPSASARFIDHATLQKQWQSLASDWQALEMNLYHVSDSVVVAEAKILNVKENAFKLAEPPDTDMELWGRAWRREAQVQQAPVTQPPTMTQAAF
jgi:hypothetical protein